MEEDGDGGVERVVIFLTQSQGIDLLGKQQEACSLRASSNIIVGEDVSLQQGPKSSRRVYERLRHLYAQIPTGQRVCSTSRQNQQHADHRRL